jgi:hypothetical protein
MPRPKLPESQLHERSFRVRLKDDDANLLSALAKKADVPPAVLLRAMVRRQLPLFALLQNRTVTSTAD